MGRLFLGMDGGGSNARARLADDAGRRLGEGRGGPANVGNDPEGALVALEVATTTALAAAGLSGSDRAEIVAVIGAAGAADPRVAARLAGAPFGFHRLRVVTDAEIASASPPCPIISAATCSAADSARSFTTTRAPCLAR